jgi:hypothetical protein
MELFWMPKKVQVLEWLAYWFLLTTIIIENNTFKRKKNNNASERSDKKTDIDFSLPSLSTR